jgi:hypothetical protein
MVNRENTDNTDGTDFHGCQLKRHSLQEVFSDGWP